MDVKLKCVFDMPTAEASAETTSAGGGGGGGGSVSAAGGSSVGTITSLNMIIGDSVKSDVPKLSVEEQVRSLSLSLFFRVQYCVLLLQQSLNLCDAAEHADSLAAELKDILDLNSELVKENLHLKVGLPLGRIPLG